MGFEGPPQLKKVEKPPEPIMPPPEVIEPKQESREQQAEIIAEAQEMRGGMIKNVLTSEMVSNGLDVLPFAGSGKMVVEAVYGSTLSGKELSGKDRVIHGAMGAGMLALDFTGVGEAIELGGKAIPLVEKIGASLAEKGAVKGAAIFAKTAEFMGRHPELTAKAEAYAEGQLRGMITQIKDYQKSSQKISEREAQDKEKIEEIRRSMSGENSSESPLPETNVETLTPTETQKEEMVQSAPEQAGPEIAEDIETGQQENKAERYREKISNPEALKIVDQNAELFHDQNASFTAQLEEYRNKETVNQDDLYKLIVEGQRLAGTLMYGGERGGKRFQHFENGDLVGKEAEAAGQRAYDEIKSQLPEEIKTSLRNAGMDVAKAEEINEAQAQRAREQKSKTIRDGYLGNQEASLYAIGVKEEDIDAFLETQSKIKELADKFGYKTSDVDAWLTKQDFETSRYRSYFEARRTARNVFTHVTSAERAQQIIKSKGLKSSNRTTSNEASLRELQAAGQTGNIEEGIYFTSGGGGYQYGFKMENGMAVPKKLEDFCFFASTGADIMASGKSVEIVSPSLKEQHESLRGKVVADFEAVDGTEIPLENMYIAVPETKMFDYLATYQEAGYSDDFAAEHIIPIPDEVIEDAIKEGGGTIQRDSKAIQNFVDTELKKNLMAASKNKDKVFATVAGREAKDPVSRGTNTIFKWQQIN